MAPVPVSVRQKIIVLIVTIHRRISLTLTLSVWPCCSFSWTSYHLPFHHHVATLFPIAAH